MILDMFRLDDKVAVITGGDRGLGAAIALAFAQAARMSSSLHEHHPSLTLSPNRSALPAAAPTPLPPIWPIPR